MKTKLFAFVIFFLWVVPAFAIEVVDTAWVRRYNGPGDTLDMPYSMSVDSAGNVYVTGRSWGSGTSADYATIKYYPNGDTAWVRRYNGPVNDYDWSTAILVDGSGNIYVGGSSWEGSVNLADYGLIKYYPDGGTAWIRKYNGPGSYWDDILAMTFDGSGNICVTGQSVGSGTNYDYATIKYDPSGSQFWVRRYNGLGNFGDYAYAIASDDLDNIYVTGASFGSGGNRDYATIKYDTGGSQLWVETYSGPGNDWDAAKDIVVDRSYNVYVTGYSVGSGTSYDYATIKYSSNGTEIWVKRYNGPGNLADYAYALALDSSGNIYVTGGSYGTSSGYDFATIKYYPNGDTAWVRRYNGQANNNDLANDIAVDNLGNIYVFGSSMGSGTNYDFVTIKYDSSGNQIWVIRYNGPGNQNDGPSEEWRSRLAVDKDRNVYVTGSSVGVGTYDDYATVKYIQYDSIPFAPAVSYYTGDAPYSVFSGNLDNDGDVDIASANTYGNNVSILKNNGNGIFQLDSSFTTDLYPYSVFCADLDGDGNLDLATANENANSVSILKNNGDGSFAAKVDYPVGDKPLSVVCADLNGDSYFDLAVANFNSNNVSILKNKGDGTFENASNYGAGSGPYSIFCADLDGDGDIDLAVADNLSDSVSILKNNGNGSFQNPVGYIAGDGPVSIFCADLDGDGDLDLAVANAYSDNISILKNNGNGIFQNKVDYATGDGARSLFCADLDGDGDLDLAVANQSANTVSALKNNGNGEFPNRVDYNAGSVPTSVFCADLDGDGDLDLVVTDVTSDSVSILMNLTQMSVNQPPKPFSLLSPTDGHTVFGTPTFRWQTPYDPNFGDQLRYDLYVSTDQFFNPDSTRIYDSLSISRLSDTLGMNTYYWKVKAYDNWGAERWSSQTWSFDVSYLTDTLKIIAFSPVDLVVTDPMGDSIGIGFNTILGATYDTAYDVNGDGDKDDSVTMPNRLVGDYAIRVLAEPGDSGTFDLGIRIDGSQMNLILMGAPSPPPGSPENIIYYAPCTQGDATGDLELDISDVVFLINYLYRYGPSPQPLERGDANSSGLVDVGDVVYLINYLFKGGPPPTC
jgi:hypothetical protein